MSQTTSDFSSIPVAVLCGGRGIMMAESPNGPINKALVNINGKPLFWWVLHLYAACGARNFILATGFQSDKFPAQLLALGGTAQARDATVFDLPIAGGICEVRLVDTGLNSTTGQRLQACKPWLEKVPRFALTYSDTLSDVDLTRELAFHCAQSSIATLVSTPPPVRFRVLGIRHGESLVRAFAPRPIIENSSINGGFYVFTHAIWNADYALEGAGALEEVPLERLATAGQLTAYEHRGAWQYCDGERDLPALSQLAQRLQARQLAPR